jgi:hypothetical protein
VTGSETPAETVSADATPNGAELARLFHAEAVAPLLARELPRLRYAAARLGTGSDVLGLDDARSRDHDWGCRLTLLVGEPDADAVPAVTGLLETHLPGTFRGLPVRFGTTWNPAAAHQVEVATVRGYAAGRLGVPVDPARGLAPLDWLVLSGQSVLEVTAGPVFADATAELAAVRSRLEWYPPDVERYALAEGWRRIAEELPYLGRAAERGDEPGARLIAARLADTIMHLAFLLSRRWMPYRKWRGTAFAALPAAGRLTEPLSAILSDTPPGPGTAPGWRRREEAIADACEVLLDLQRSRRLPVTPTATIPFFDRPYRTVPGELMTGLRAGITDPGVARLPVGVGTVEQWADAHTILSGPGRRAALRAAYLALAELPLRAGERDPVAVRVGHVGAPVAGEVAGRLLQDRGARGAQRGDRRIGVVAEHGQLQRVPAGGGEALCGRGGEAAEGDDGVAEFQLDVLGRPFGRVPEGLRAAEQAAVERDRPVDVDDVQVRHEGHYGHDRFPCSRCCSRCCDRWRAKAASGSPPLSPRMRRMRSASGP